MNCPCMIIFCYNVSKIVAFPFPLYNSGKKEIVGV